jgi:hypothetical protein
MAVERGRRIADPAAAAGEGVQGADKWRARSVLSQLRRPVAVQRSTVASVLHFDAADDTDASPI